jgi:hypothetical protein
MDDRGESNQTSRENPRERVIRCTAATIRAPSPALG